MFIKIGNLTSSLVKNHIEINKNEFNNINTQKIANNRVSVLT